MPHTVLNDDEQRLLRSIRENGSVSLLPEARTFQNAESLVAKGLVRAVRARDVPEATYLLSGEGIAVAGPPSRPNQVD